MGLPESVCDRLPVDLLPFLLHRLFQRDPENDVRHDPGHLRRVSHPDPGCIRHAALRRRLAVFDRACNAVLNGRADRHVLCRFCAFRHAGKEAECDVKREMKQFSSHEKDDSTQNSDVTSAFGYVPS